MEIEAINRSYHQSFSLDAASIDRISAKLEEVLAQRKEELQNRLRIRLSIEEALLRLQEHFGETQEVKFSIQRTFGRVIVNLEIEGEPYNPLSKEDTDMEDWSSSLLTEIGLSFKYDYSGYTNTLRLVLPSRPINPVLEILVALAGGVLLGCVGRMIVPDPAANAVLSWILSAVENLWFSLLKIMAGPVIFFMVITTIMNTRKINQLGGNSGKITSHYFLLSFLIAAAAAAAAYILFRPEVVSFGVTQNEQWYGSLALKFLPSDLLEPFTTANTPQLLLLAFILGGALNIIGTQAGTLRKAVRQTNMIGLLVTEWVSRLVPLFTCLLLGFQIWQGYTTLLKGVWKCVLLAVSLTVVVLIIALVIVSRKEGISFSKLLKKLWLPFRITVLSGSLGSSFGQTVRSTVQDLGLDSGFTRIGLTHGLILYMPISAIGTISFLIYVASVYQFRISWVWFVLTVLYSVLMFVATPPVPGANVLAYITILLTFNLDIAVVIDAMVFDIMFGILASAANQMLLQLDLVLQADKLGLLNKEKIKN